VIRTRTVVAIVSTVVALAVWLWWVRILFRMFVG
jgi:hypothetical protein